MKEAILIIREVILGLHNRVDQSIDAGIAASIDILSPKRTRGIGFVIATGINVPNTTRTRRIKLAMAGSILATADDFRIFQSAEHNTSV